MFPTNSTILVCQRGPLVLVYAYNRSVVYDPLRTLVNSFSRHVMGNPFVCYSFSHIINLEVAQPTLGLNSSFLVSHFLLVMEI